MKNSDTIRNLKSIGFCLALFAGLFICSCDDDDSVPPDTTTTRVPYVCATCATTSQALPENDNSERGIYKGVFSDGTIAINFKNEIAFKSEIERATGVIYYKNRIINITESPEVVVSTEKPTRTMFVGLLDGREVSLIFSVNPDGTLPQISDFRIGGAGEMMPCIVFKEKSNMLIEAYEGNYLKAINNNPPGDTVPGDTFEFSGKVDPGLVVADESAVIVGGLKLVLSRSESMWMLFKVMNGVNGSVIDNGSINDGTLMSDVTGKKVAYLRSDELNYNELTPSGLIYLHAERKR